MVVCRLLSVREFRKNMCIDYSQGPADNCHHVAYSMALSVMSMLSLSAFTVTILEDHCGINVIVRPKRLHAIRKQTVTI